MRLELVRYAYTPEEVLGLLKFPVLEDGSYLHTLWTVECPWKGNLPFVSCVQDGAYRLSPFDSIKHPETFSLSGAGMPGRSGILIHAGNDVSDTTGCIVPGITRLALKVFESRDAMRLLNSVLEREEIHHLIIGPGLGARIREGEQGQPPEDAPNGKHESKSGNGNGQPSDPDSGVDGLPTG